MAANERREPAIEAVGRRAEFGSRNTAGSDPKKRLELGGLREEIAFVSAGFSSERMQGLQATGCGSGQLSAAAEAGLECGVERGTDEAGDYVNLKRVHWLYAEQGLAVRRRRGKPLGVSS